METLVLFAPLIRALICGFGWKFIGENSACWVATGLLFLSAILSWILFISFDGVTVNISILRWIEVGHCLQIGLFVSIGLRPLCLLLFQLFQAWFTCTALDICKVI